ncbi:neutral zinc metallopeptidase [Actinokineospora sp. G85]|uniref:neutral zinc metallopeptidase n=1 Tax=Actinokineospora sp. G85 TaxID=3406626 RepID=UPI003C75A6FC
MIAAVMVILAVSVFSIGAVGRIVNGGETTVVRGQAFAVGEQSTRSRSGAVTLDDLAANKLVAEGAPAPRVDCPLPAVDTTEPGLLAFYQAALTCLNATWQPVLVARGLPFTVPRVTVTEWSSARCGFTPDEDEALAFYCPGDRMIAMPRDRMVRTADDNAGYHLAVLAHEYGHHLQLLSGLLEDAALLEADLDEAGAAEVSRRAELQANCLAGVFLAAAALTPELVDDADSSFADTISSDSHGSAKNQVHWAAAGKQTTAPAACDTWSAPDHEVD